METIVTYRFAYGSSAALIVDNSKDVDDSQSECSNRHYSLWTNKNMELNYQS